MAKQVNKTKFVRAKKDKNYTVLNNDFIDRNDLSWKAKGLLTYLLRLPDDWNINLNEIMTHSTDGKSGFRSGWDELVEAGYIERKPVRTADNKKIDYWQTIIYERGAEQRNKQLPENQEVGKSLDTSLVPENQEVGKSLDTSLVPENLVTRFSSDKVSKELENQPLLSTDNNQVLNKLNTNDNDTGAKNLSLNDFALSNNFYLNNLQLSELNQYQGQHFDNDDDIIRLAFKKSAEQGVYKYAYVKAILDNWIKAGIRTVEQAHEADKDFKKNKKKSPSKAKGEDLNIYKGEFEGVTDDYLITLYRSCKAEGTLNEIVSVIEELEKRGVDLGD